MILKANGAFNYRLLYDFMALQDDCLYATGDGVVRKALSVDRRRVLFELSESEVPDAVEVKILFNEGVSGPDIEAYVREWLDLDYDIEKFYQFAEADRRLKHFYKELSGFRMLAYVDITDAFVWSVVGQQINMKFAFILKRRIVEHFDRYVEYEGTKYWLMPDASELLTLDVETMREMQISNRKAEYISNCAKGIEAGELSKAHMRRFDSYEEALAHLIKVKGIGPWSANVILMRTLKFRNAVPIGDAGLKNAIKLTDELEVKPTRGYIDGVISTWGEFGTYATLYMWRILG